MIRFLIASHYIPYENSQIMYLCGLQMGPQINQKIGGFFGYLETRSQILLSLWKVWLHGFLCSQNCVQPVSQNP